MFTALQDLRIAKIIPLLGGARGGSDAVESRHAAAHPLPPSQEGNARSLYLIVCVSPGIIHLP